jgi:hypothetical protein
VEEKEWGIAGAKVGKMSEGLEVENRSIGKNQHLSMRS